MRRINLTPQAIRSIKQSPKGQLPRFLEMKSRESLKTENYRRVQRGQAPMRIPRRPSVRDVA